METAPNPYIIIVRIEVPGRCALVPYEEGSTVDCKDLSPDLREKAKVCTSFEEQLAHVDFVNGVFDGGELD